MIKNGVLLVLLVVVAVVITLMLSGRLVWTCQADLAGSSPEDVLEKAIEIHRPQVISINDQELLHIPVSQLSGKNWSVRHEFYVFEEGSLRRLDYIQGSR